MIPCTDFQVMQRLVKGSLAGKGSHLAGHQWLVKGSHLAKDSHQWLVKGHIWLVTFGW